MAISARTSVRPFARALPVLGIAILAAPFVSGCELFVHFDRSRIGTDTGVAMDSGVTPDSGADAGRDGGSDTGPVDANLPDSMIDAFTPDTNPPDTGIDGGTDAGTDTGVDGGSDAGSDGGTDANLPDDIAAFTHGYITVSTLDPVSTTGTTAP